MRKLVALRTVLAPGRSEKFVIGHDDRSLTFAETISAWRDDTDFRAFFIAELAATGFPAFFWETPPIRRGGIDFPYEHVAIRSESLARVRPDARAFESKFAAAPQSVVSFRNLGGDALLLAPRPLGDRNSYGHFAAFARSAPPEQQHELFRSLGRAIDRALASSGERLWVSTSGLGIAWLHLRLDSRPKYYQHRPYAES